MWHLEGTLETTAGMLAQLRDHTAQRVAFKEKHVHEQFIEAVADRKILLLVFSSQSSDRSSRW